MKKIGFKNKNKKTKMAATAAAAAVSSDNTNQEVHDNCEGIHRPELLKELDDYIVERISFLAIEENFHDFLAIRDIHLFGDDLEYWNKIYRELFFESEKVSLGDLLDKTERFLNEKLNNDFDESEELIRALHELHNFYVKEMGDVESRYVACLEKQEEMDKKTDNLEIEKTLKKPKVIIKRLREEPDDVSDDDDDVMVNSLQPEDRVDRSKKPRLDLGDDDVDDKGNLKL